MWRTRTLVLMMLALLAQPAGAAARLDPTSTASLMTKSGKPDLVTSVNAAAPAAAAAKSANKSASRSASKSARESTRQSASEPNPVVIKVQVLLDSAGFSPGEISGRLDENTEKAVAAFKAAHQLTPDGKIDSELWNVLAADSAEPVLKEYVISREDVQGPFLEKLPAKMEDMKTLDRLSYTGPREALAEKFHMSESLLAALNPKKPFDQPDTTIVVANVMREPKGKAARIEIDKPARVLRVFGPGDKLLAVYPASIGSTEKPAPSGTFKVTSVTHNPTYRYDPAYAFKGVTAKRPFTIKPGPNNPVGTVWIGLSAQGGYGIHGTPDPSKVGKTASHGCIRLTNWDAEELAGMLGNGVPVAFLDQAAGAQAGAQGSAEAPHETNENRRQPAPRAHTRIQSNRKALP
jgi:lipoprotein-anchoring transpeptidase ErfK/SrfK